MIYKSPNFDSRGENQIRFIILHYTDMLNATEALQRLCDPESRVSAHYLIDKTGKTYSLVDDQHRAWHAGVSSWKGIQDVNAHSIGIELDNPGHSHTHRSHNHKSHRLEPFPRPQIATLITLLKELVKRHGIDPQQIWGHSDVAPGRKIDPGPLFPWGDLASEGLGVWPRNITLKKDVPTLYEIQQKLCSIGYDCPVSGQMDEKTAAVIEAFKMHFAPIASDTSTASSYSHLFGLNEEFIQIMMSIHNNIEEKYNV